MGRNFLFLLLLCAATSPGDGSAQTQYSVQDLGPLVNLPGRADSGPTAINDAGVVTGINASPGYYQALVYSNNSWQAIGTLGGSQSLAAGLNNQGLIVGYAQTAGGGTNAFLWNPLATDGIPTNPHMKNLGTLGGPVSEAYAINNSGQITGYSDVPGNPTDQQHAFVYTASKMIDIGALLSQLPNSFGYAINAKGHVAGTAYDASYSTPHAFFFDGTNSSDLGVFGGLGANALALNNSDWVAGYVTTTSMVDHAFKYLNGTFTDLGTLGGDYSYALALNNSNILVGGSFVDVKNSVYHAFVWQNALMQDLNTKLDSSGSGWTLIEARAINDFGQIAGVGTFGGTTHGFLLSSTSVSTNAAPVVSLFRGSDSEIVIQFTTVLGKLYNLQTNGRPATTGWADASSALQGTGGTVSVTNSTTGSASVFYRVRMSGP